MVRQLVSYFRQLISRLKPLKHMSILVANCMLFPVSNAIVNTLFFFIQQHFIVEISDATVKARGKSVIVHLVGDLIFGVNGGFGSVGVSENHLLISSILILNLIKGKVLKQMQVCLLAQRCARFRNSCFCSDGLKLRLRTLFIFN